MYKVSQILDQEPALVSATVIDVVALGEILGVYNLTGDAIAAIGLAVTSVLAMFYVRAKTVTKDYLEEIGHPVPE